MYYSIIEFSKGKPQKGGNRRKVGAMERTYGWPERILVWALTLVFLAAGVAKLLGAPEIVAVFERFGLPHWFMLVTAGVEILGAVGLHLRRGKIGLAAPTLLATTMIVGAGFHLIHDTPPQALPAAALALLALAVLFLRRPQNTEAAA